MKIQLTLTINNTSYTTSVPNEIFDAVAFIYNRIPNSHEIVQTLIPYSSLLVLFGSIPYSFGSNPTSKAVFRDAIKFPGIFITYFYSTEIGATGIHRDIGDVVGASLKTTCKVTTLGTATYFWPALLAGPVGWVTLGAIALGANFACEMPARTFKVISREYQKTCKYDTNCDLSYWEFIEQNLINLSMRGVQESITKTFTSDMVVGNTLGFIFNYIKQKATYISNSVIEQGWTSVAGHSIILTGQLGMYNKVNTCLNSLHNSGLLIKTATYTVVGITELAITIGREFMITNIFIPIVNTVADSSIPDWLFGDTQNTITTTIGTTTMVYCSSKELNIPFISKKLNTLICTAIGIGAKELSNTAFTYFINTRESQQEPENDLTEKDSVNQNITGEIQQNPDHVEL